MKKQVISLQTMLDKKYKTRHFVKLGYDLTGMEFDCIMEIIKNISKEEIM